MIEGFLHVEIFDSGWENLTVKCFWGGYNDLSRDLLTVLKTIFWVLILAPI